MNDTYRCGNCLYAKINIRELGNGRDCMLTKKHVSDGDKCEEYEPNNIMLLHEQEELKVELRALRQRLKDKQSEDLSHGKPCMICGRKRWPDLSTLKEKMISHDCKPDCWLTQEISKLNK